MRPRGGFSRSIRNSSPIRANEPNGEDVLRRANGPVRRPRPPGAPRDAAGGGYARNQRAALCRFLTDGRLPLHSNRSELELRRQVIGRNWLFVGTDEAATVNTTFVSLLVTTSQEELLAAMG